MYSFDSGVTGSVRVAEVLQVRDREHGDAEAGERYFRLRTRATCSTPHSIDARPPVPSHSQATGSDAHRSAPQREQAERDREAEQEPVECVVRLFVETDGESRNDHGRERQRDAMNETHAGDGKPDGVEALLRDLAGHAASDLLTSDACPGRSAFSTPSSKAEGRYNITRGRLQPRQTRPAVRLSSYILIRKSRSACSASARGISRRCSISSAMSFTVRRPSISDMMKA